MLDYDRIDISEGIGILCHYWCFLDKNFNYGPYPCDGCCDMMQKSIDFKILLSFMLKKVYTQFIFSV